MILGPLRVNGFHSNSKNYLFIILNHYNFKSISDRMSSNLQIKMKR